MPRTLARRVLSEGLGTGLLLAAVVGSGIMAERLAGGNAAVALLANAVATGAALLALILTFGPVSGATSTRWSPLRGVAGQPDRRDLLPYVAAQVRARFSAWRPRTSCSACRLRPLPPP